MTPWLLFALSAPLLWSIANVFDAALRRHFIKDDRTLMWITGMARLPFVILFLMISGLNMPSVPVVIAMMLGGALWTLPFFLYYKALNKEEPSRIVLLMQVIPVFTLLIAFLMLGENLTTPQGIAFVLLMTGGIFSALKRLEGRWHFSQAFWWMLIASFLWALSDVIFKKYEMEFGGFMPAFSIYFLGSFLTSLTMMAGKKNRKALFSHFKNLPGRAWAMLTASEIAGVTGSLAFAYALVLGKASLTSVLMGIQPLFVLLIGAFLKPLIKELSREDLSRRALFFRMIAFGFIAAGLIALNG